MNLDITDIPLGMRPEVDLPDPALLAYVGEVGIRQFVSEHYDRLVQSDIKELFPTDPEGLAASKKNSADFFIQICGGPDYFNQNRGRPFLARRHAPFRITPSGRVVWLQCYQPVLRKLLEQGVPEEPLQRFWDYINIFSAWMLNTPDETA